MEETDVEEAGHGSIVLLASMSSHVGPNVSGLGPGA